MPSEPHEHQNSHDEYKRRADISRESWYSASMPADPATAAELCALSALEMADLVRRREISPVELIQAQLDRIEAVEPHINAFQLVRAEAALREASKLADRRQLADLPLAGVP